MYLLKLAMRPWRLALMSQLFSALAVGFLLLMVGFLFWMQKGLHSVLSRLHGEQVITAYIERNVEAKNEAKIVDSIRVSLGSQTTADIKWVSVPQFIQTLKGPYPELGRELEDLGHEINDVVPRYVSITGMLPEEAVDKIKVLPGIEKAESSKDRNRQVIGAFSTLRWIVRVLMGGVALALLTGLIHLSRMNAYLHRDALSLLKSWGASRSVLSAPGLISGCSVGALGGVIAAVGWVSFGVSLTHHVKSFSTLLKWMPAAQSSFSILLLGIGIFVGAIAGGLGTLSANQNEGGTRI